MDGSRSHGLGLGAAAVSGRFAIAGSPAGSRYNSLSFFDDDVDNHQAELD